MDRFKVKLIDLAIKQSSLINIISDELVALRHAKAFVINDKHIQIATYDLSLPGIYKKSWMYLINSNYNERNN